MNSMTGFGRATGEHAGFALTVQVASVNRRSLDPDMLDEKIRSVLGYAAEGDIVIPRDEFERLLENARKAQP